MVALALRPVDGLPTEHWQDFGALEAERSCLGSTDLLGFQALDRVDANNPQREEGRPQILSKPISFASKREPGEESA